MQSNLNGKNFLESSIKRGQGIVWNTWRGVGHSLRDAQMALLPTETGKFNSYSLKIIL